MDVTSTDFLKKNRRLLGPIILFVLSFFILLRVIIPLISTISDEKRKLSDAHERLQKLTNTQNAIQSINNDTIADNIELTKSALPMNKDIIQIYTSVVDIANKNNLQVNSFSVKVGQVYNKDGSISTKDSGDSNGQEFPTLDISVGLDASNTDSLFEFSNEIMRSLPLAQINNFSTDENSGLFDISFYYKPVNTDALAQQEFVTPLTQKDQQTLQTIQSFSQN